MTITSEKLGKELQRPSDGVRPLQRILYFLCLTFASFTSTIFHRFNRHKGFKLMENMMKKAEALRTPPTTSVVGIRAGDIL